MQIGRLFEIVYLLMEKKRVTAAELAERFEVSKRTVLRDVDTLTTAGIPIYTVQGKGGGISLLDNYVLNKTLITEDEQNQILFALQGISATGQTEPDGILRKLKSLFEKSGSDWIEVDFSRWGNSTADKLKFETLKSALIKGNALSFAYSNSYGKTSDRSAYPLKLVFKSTSWYLQGFCLTKNDYRTFKINRMRNVKLLEVTFDKNEYNPPEIEAMEYNSPEIYDVKLYFPPEMAYRVYDEFNERDIEKKEDGSIIVYISLPDDSWAYDFILSFGAAVEILEPQYMREKFLRHLEKIKNKYSNKT